MRVIQEAFEGGLLVSRLIYVYDPDPPVPTAVAVTEEPQENHSPLVTMAEWLTSKAKQDG